MIRPRGGGNPPHTLEFDVDSYDPIEPFSLSLSNLTDSQYGNVAASYTQGAWDAGDPKWAAIFTFPGYSQFSTSGILPDGNYDAVLNNQGADPDDPTTTHGIAQTDFFWWTGDINHDRTVDTADYNILFAHWAQSGTYSQGDVNYDGTVDLSDFNIVASKFTTRLQAPPTEAGETMATTESSSSILVSWAPADVQPDRYDVYRSTDGTNFDRVGEVDGDVTSFEDTSGLVDGTQYWYKVRAYTEGAGHSMAVNRANSVTVLPAPTNVAASILNDGSGDVQVTWTPQSTTQTSFVVSRYEVVDGAWQTVPSESVTAAGDQTSYTFTDTPAGALNRFSVKAVNPIADSVDSIPDEGFTEPTATWTTVYADDTTPSYVSAQWDPPYYHQDGTGGPWVSGYGNGTVKLTLSGLPRHTYARVNFRLDGPTFGGTNITGTADGAALNVSRADGSWYLNIDSNGAGLPDAFKDSSSTMTITFQTSGFSQGQTWGPGPRWVNTYFPFVSVSGSGTAIEDGSENAHFTVTRDAGGSKTVLEDPLTVPLQDAGGSASPGTDYIPPGSITISSGQSSGETDVPAVNDDEAEGVLEIFQSIIPQTASYALSAPPTTAPNTNPSTAKAKKDDDVSVRSITVSLVVQFDFQQLPTVNKVNGLWFWNAVEVEGEHLDQVDIQQEINSRTTIWDFFNVKFSDFEVDRYLSQIAYDNGFNYNPVLVNSHGWQTDDRWVRKPVERLDAKAGYGVHLDSHSFGIQAYAFGTPEAYFCYLADVADSFRITTFKRGSGTPLKVKEWGFEWSNLDCAWQQGDVPVPPYFYCAVSYEHGGVGTISSTGIQFLDNLNG